jgi:hypothetical protein
MWTLSRSGLPSHSCTVARLRMVRTGMDLRPRGEWALRMVGKWWARVGLAVAAIAAGVTSGVAPAAADGSDGCVRVERAVYGITMDGGLVQHTFCVDGNLSDHFWLDGTVVADSGWSDTAYAFWSGADRSPGVIYRVSASTGALSWASHVTGPWRQVGSGVTGNWRKFISVVSPEPGVIYTLEASKTVRRWVHTGWQDGSDTWTGPETVATGFTGSRLLGLTAEGLVGLFPGPAGPIVSAWSYPGLAPAALKIGIPASVVSDQITPFTLDDLFQGISGHTRSRSA